MAVPACAHYIEGWPQQGDFGVVAENVAPLGAAWWRYFRADDPGYGFVDETIPEVSIGVRKRHRGRGIGRAMLNALAAEAERRELRALSLSVEADNDAMRLYERVGFVPVGDSVEAVTMVMIIGGRE